MELRRHGCLTKQGHIVPASMDGVNAGTKRTKASGGSFGQLGRFGTADG